MSSAAKRKGVGQRKRASGSTISKVVESNTQIKIEAEKSLNDLVILIAGRQHDEARHLATQLGSTHSDSSAILEGCGSALLHLRDFDAASKMLEAAHKKNKSSPTLLSNLGSLYL